MRAVRICVLIAITMLAGFAQQSGSRESDKTRVLSLETAWNEAERNKDVSALAGLLAATFSYTDSDGTFSNREQFLESIKDVGYHPEQIVNESMTAQVYDHAVVVTGSYREKGSDKGKAYSRRGRFTDMWVQDGGRWLCAASHETLISH